MAYISEQEIRDLASYKQRVASELGDLNTKLGDLGNFLQSDLFHSLDAAEQERLRAQQTFMNGYAAVLGQRIKAWL